MKLLITIENLKEFRPLAETIPAERVLPYIQEAQQVDLKRLLGDALYVDFMLRFDNPVDGKYAAYQDLLKGKSYVDGSTTIEHPGLIGFLSYTALAKIYANNQINLTRFGLVAKKDENSEPITPEGMNIAINELRAVALALQVDIQNYLRVNASLYPLYSYATGNPPSLGVRFWDPQDSTIANLGRTTESR